MESQCKGCSYLESKWCHLYNIYLKKAIEHCKGKDQVKD